MNIFTPTREKLIATICIYFFLLLGSIFKIGFFWFIYPDKLFTEIHPLKLQKIFPLFPFDWGVIFTVLGNAVEVAFVYIAVCIIIEKLSKSKHQLV